MSRQVLLGLVAVTAVIFCATILTSSGAGSHSLITKEEASVYVQFAEWSSLHGKLYREEEERAYRFLKFRQNLEFIQSHNRRYQKGLETFEVALNVFADMDNIEFASIYTSLKTKENSVTTQCNVTLDVLETLPESVDWTNKAVNPVRNQGNCGSCWAFSAIGAVEGLNAIQNNKLEVFSVQQLVDCATKAYGNEGCNGGEMDAAMWYVKDNGIALDSKYPYTGRDGKKCLYTENMKAFGIADCSNIKPNNTKALMSAVAKQPVSIAVEADTIQFQFYSKGVFSGKCGTDLDHGIVLVGYGNEGGKDYWRCKNSWGPSWGSSGYILIAKSDEDGPGQCGIMMDNAVPTA